MREFARKDRSTHTVRHSVWYRWSTSRTAASLPAILMLVVSTVAALLFACTCPRTLRAQQTDALRTISGVVEDDGHEPLKGAVVELTNPTTHAVVSYLTQADGRFAFKRLDSHTDFDVSATFRGHRSVTHHISKFDSHLEKVLTIVCKTY